MFLRNNLPGILWALFILFVCGIPGEQVPDPPSFFEFFYLDKLAHAILFLILALLLGIGFKRQYSIPLFRSSTKVSIFLISTLYGLLIEALQYAVFTDRYFENGDLLANAVGALLGTVAFRGLYGKELA